MKDIYDSKRELLVITCVYFLAHGFLLLATGRWWDDWVSWHLPKSSLANWASQIGRPSIFFIFGGAHLLPEPSYRILTFTMFFLCTIFLFFIVSYWIGLDKKETMMICLLYAVMPHNDARIILAVFPYTVGLFLFMSGMFVLSESLFHSKLTWQKRICTLILFFFSYILNSNLCFYAVVLLMILCAEKNILRMMRYIDYIVLPIIFFIIKNRFFKPWGLYENYNQVKVDKVWQSIRSLPAASRIVFESLWNNAYTYGNKYVLVSCVLTCMLIIVVEFNDVKKICYYIMKKDYCGDEQSTDVVKYVLVMFLGLVCVFASLLPYLVVRPTIEVQTAGIIGRDSVLIAFGSALFFNGMLKSLGRTKVANVVLCAFISCSVLYFNVYYISYQQDYYRQLGFQNVLKEHSELEEQQNIVYFYNDPGLINSQSFYALAGNAEVVFERQNHLFIPVFESYEERSQHENAYFKMLVKNELYHMREVDVSHRAIDAIVEYSMPISYKDTARLKFLEIFNHPKFIENIHNVANGTVYINGTDEFEKKLDMEGFQPEI